jgi:hypothetical protein
MDCYDNVHARTIHRRVTCLLAIAMLLFVNAPEALS